MVTKEHKACLLEFLQNYKLGYYSVTRPFPSLRKGQQCQTRQRLPSLLALHLHHDEHMLSCHYGYESVYYIYGLIANNLLRLQPAIMNFMNKYKSNYYTNMQFQASAEAPP